MNRSVQTVSLTLLALLLAGCQSMGSKPTEQKAEERWNTVRASMKLQLAAQQSERGQFEESLAGANDAIALDPQCIDAYILAAKAHMEFGRLASAEQVINAAQAQKLTSPDLTYLMGVILEQRGQLDAALEKYRSARTSGAPKLDYLIGEAECLVALDRASEALDLLESQASVFDDNADLATLAGRTALLLERHDRAVHWFRQALNRNPESPSVSRELGLLLARLNRCKEAVPVLRPVSELQIDGPATGSTFRALATCHLALNDPAAAIAVLNPYLASHPADPSAQLLAAQAALATNDSLFVTRSLYLAEQHGAPLAQTAYLRAVLAAREGDLILAVENVEKVLSENPADADAACLLGDLRAASGDPSAAADAYSRALAADPGNTWAASGMARVALPPP